MSAPVENQNHDGAATQSTAPRRILGEAWQDWDFSLASVEPESRAPAGLFLLHALLVALLAAGAWVLLVWLTEPRLQALGFSSGLLHGTRIAGSGLLLLPGLLLWGVLLPRAYPRFLARALLVFAVWIWSATVPLARLLRVSRDRLGHAFVQVNNALTLAARWPGPGTELLVLAPRCLRPEIMQRLQRMSDDAGARFVVVGGGEQALAAVAEVAPGAVLAVACERDLVAGIRDVTPRLSVLGLANRRPEGPCRNSEIDLGEAQTLLTQLRDLLPQGR